MTQKKRDELLEQLNPYIKFNNGNIIFFENYALAAMLIDNAVEVGGNKTTEIYVNCNDIFVPAADAENIPEDKIEELYKYWKEDRKEGAIKWVRKQRGY